VCYDRRWVVEVSYTPDHVIGIFQRRPRYMIQIRNDTTVTSEDRPADEEEGPVGAVIDRELLVMQVGLCLDAISSYSELCERSYCCYCGTYSVYQSIETTGARASVKDRYRYRSSQRRW